MRFHPLLICVLFMIALGAGLPLPIGAEGHAAPESTATTAPAPGYLHTDGARLLDAAGEEVRLTGINWFGLETCAFAPHGLWVRNWRALLRQIKALGFNTIRLPFSSQLLDPGSRPNGIDYSLNPDLRGLSGLQIMDRIVAEAHVLGLKVLLDRHRPDCGAQSPLWYTDRYSERRWIADWVTLARRYAGNDAVIGADLHNEPHGPATWGDGNPATDWRLAAERAGNAILRANPHWLIVVEGVEHLGTNDWYWWGGNLAAAGAAPVRLIRPHQLVYEVHDYGPEVSNQSWFSAPDFPRNLAGLWDRHWGYLQQQGIAPVLVGEFGGKAVDSGTEGAWIHALVRYIHAHRLSYTFWCLNPNSGDTGGMLQDDWTTVNAAKMALLQNDLAPLIGAGAPRAPASAPRTPSSRAAQPRRATATLAHQKIDQRVTTARRVATADARRSQLARRHQPVTTRAATQMHRRTRRDVSITITVRPSVTTGISTGEDDLTLLLPAQLYHVRITISVHRSAPGTDPGEANPQALPGDALNGHSVARAAIEGALLVYTFTDTVLPAGRVVAAARFDFTSGRQNQDRAHRYGRDTYTIRYATTPAGSLTKLVGHF